MSLLKKVALGLIALSLVLVNLGCEIVVTTNYTVTFDAEGGSPTPSSQTVSSGSTLTKPTDPTRSGYTFLGWFDIDNPDETDSLWIWNFSTKAVNFSTTLHAGWAAIQVQKYTVTFDAQGGSPTPSSQAVSSGSYATKPATDPTRSGYTFLGWYTIAGANENTSTTDYKWVFTADPVTMSGTLYAGWQQNKGYINFLNNFSTTDQFGTVTKYQIKDIECAALGIAKDSDILAYEETSSTYTITPYTGDVTVKYSISANGTSWTPGTQIITINIGPGNTKTSTLSSAFYK